MKALILSGAALCLLLVGCGGSGKSSDSSATQAPVGPKLTVSSLPAGTYEVVLGDETAPETGQYFAAADGSRLLVVNNSKALASKLYKGAADGSWQGLPAVTSDTSISFLRSAAITLKSIDLKSLAGNYSALVQGGVSSFSLAADGKISAASSSNCKLSGTLGAEWVLGTRKLSLTTSGCSGLPVSLQGVAIQDGDYAPAVLRFVLDDGSQIAELWAYPES